MIHTSMARAFQGELSMARCGDGQCKVGRGRACWTTRFKILSQRALGCWGMATLLRVRGRLQCSERKMTLEQSHGAANGRPSAFPRLRCGATCCKTWLEQYTWAYDEERKYGAEYKEHVE